MTRIDVRKAILVLSATFALVAFMIVLAPPAAQADGPVGYYVQWGDTLFSISRRYGTSVQAIKTANGLLSDYIYAGQHLTIPVSAPTPVPPPNGFTCQYSCATPRYAVLDCVALWHEGSVIDAGKLSLLVLYLSGHDASRPMLNAGAIIPNLHGCRRRQFVPHCDSVRNIGVCHCVRQWSLESQFHLSRSNIGDSVSEHDYAHGYCYTLGDRHADHHSYSNYDRNADRHGNTDDADRLSGHRDGEWYVRTEQLGACARCDSFVAEHGKHNPLGDKRHTRRARWQIPLGSSAWRGQDL